MTPQEAKKMLKAKLECLKNETSGINHDCNMRLCDGCSLNYEQGNMGEQKEALQMAIKALKQQHCEDCISRTEALRLIDEERQHLLRLNMDGAEHIIVHYARRIIEDMPSVTPKAQNALEEDPRRCENCIHFVTRDSAGVVLCGSDARECDFTPKEG